MISLEPDFVQVLELPVLRDVLRGEMIVVIEDGLFLREFVVESASCGSGQKKVVVNESHGSLCAPPVSCQEPKNACLAVQLPIA
jgi:hypothetical protein